MGAALIIAASPFSMIAQKLEAGSLFYCPLGAKLRKKQKQKQIGHLRE